MKIRKLIVFALTAHALSLSPLVWAEGLPQGEIHLAQAGEGRFTPKAGDSRNATLGDIRWIYTQLRAEIRATDEAIRADIRSEHEGLRADIRATNEAIRALNDRLFYILVAVIGGMLGILGVLLSPLLRRKESAPGGIPSSA